MALPIIFVSPKSLRSGSIQPKRTPGRPAASDAGSSSLRPERIFPEEAPGEDRIPDQLMFLPSTVPENQVRRLTFSY